MGRVQWECIEPAQQKKGGNVNSLGSHLINCSAVLWLGGKSCSGPRLGAAVLFAMWLQSDQSTAVVAVVFDNLDGRGLGQNDCLCLYSTLCRALRLKAVQLPL